MWSGKKSTLVSKVFQHWKSNSLSEQFFWVYAGIVLLSLLAGVALEFYYLAALPALLLLVYVTVVDFQKVFYLLLFCLPLSTEFTFPNGFGTDLPTEPLMLGLMLVGILFLAGQGQRADGRLLRHPLTLLLLLHVGWIGITAITSGEVLVSVKFLLAKIWYVVVFYFLAARILSQPGQLKNYVWVILLPLLLTVCTVMVRHASYGFSFADVYQVLGPFYRNHVAYASIMVLFLPYLWFARQWYPYRSSRWWLLLGSLLFLLVAIQLSYTRAAYLAAFIAVGAYFIIQWRLTRYVLLLVGVGVVLGLFFMAHNNRYLDYAPNYETTISHQNFDNLVEATYQLEDISTMERLYRWVAGFQMSVDRPWMGFGPGNFYTFYRGYTITSFRTYVSDNPEQSGIHSYYLMILVEQGIIGVVLFLLLCGFLLLWAEGLYHRLSKRRDQQAVMMAILSQIIILSLLIINDLIETDKVGSFFFMNMAILVTLDLYGTKKTTVVGAPEPH